MPVLCGSVSASEALVPGCSCVESTLGYGGSAFELRDAGGEMLFLARVTETLQTKQMHGVGRERDVCGCK